MQDSDDISSGVRRVIGLLDEYDLTKEDWDSIMEVGHFDGRKDPVASIPSKVNRLIICCRSAIDRSVATVVDQQIVIPALLHP